MARADQRLAQQHAGIVDEIARGEAVGAVDDHVVVAEDALDVAGDQLLFMRDHAQRRVQRAEPRLRGNGLAAADLVGAEQDLPLQVGQLDAVVIDEADGAHAGRGQVQRGG